MMQIQALDPTRQHKARKYHCDANTVPEGVAWGVEKNREGRSLYFVINRLEGIPPKPGWATNKHITRRILLFVDHDPIRPTGTSATDAQRDAARSVAERVRKWIGDTVGAEAVRVVDSGNGFHVYYVVDLPPEDTRVQELLARLSVKFSTDQVKVDNKVFDARRISRVPGSVNTKGEVHRLCTTVEHNPDAPTVTAEQLDTLIAALPEPPKVEKPAKPKKTPPPPPTPPTVTPNGAAPPEAPSSPPPKPARKLADEQDGMEGNYRAWLRTVKLEVGLPKSAQDGDAKTYRYLAKGLFHFGLTADRVLRSFCHVINSDLLALNDAWTEAELLRKLNILEARGPDARFDNFDNFGDGLGRTLVGRDGGGELVTLNLSAVTPKPVVWLVPDTLAAGMLTLFAGPGGQGKSTVTLDIAAALTRGKPALGLDYPNPIQGRVLLVGCEDDVDRVIVPRLIALGADRSKVEVVRGVKRSGNGETIDFDLTHVAELRAKLLANPDIKLIVIDPVSSFVARAGKDEHKDGEVRSIIDPLALLASETGVAIILVKHLNKGSGSAVSRVAGSVAFVNGVRVAYVFGRGHDPETRVMAAAKANVLPRANTAIAFKLRGLNPIEAATMIDADGCKIDYATRDQIARQMFRPEWLGLTDITADQALSPPTAQKRTRADECADMLPELLDGHAWPDQEIVEKVGERGFSSDAYRKAKSKLNQLPPGDPNRLSMQQRGKRREKQWWVWFGPPDRPTPPRPEPTCAAASQE